MAQTQQAEALKVLFREQAIEHTTTHKERGHRAYALRLLGEISARFHPPEREQAEAYYQHALALAEHLGMHHSWLTATSASARCIVGLDTVRGLMLLCPPRSRCTAP